MNKSTAITEIVRATPATPVIFTTGYACRIAQRVADRPNHFYMTGSMGLAAAIGIGLAARTGATALVVDGDGSLLMNPGTLVVAGAEAALPLVHVLLDDRQYASTGGQCSPGSRVDFPALARSCGYRDVVEARSAAELADALSAALPTPGAPVFVHCVLEEADGPVPPRVGADLGEHAERFAAWCQGRRQITGNCVVPPAGQRAPAETRLPPRSLER